MKAKLTDLGPVFELYLEPETLEESSDLIRFGLNAIRERPCINSGIGDNGNLFADILIRSRKERITRFGK